MDLDDDIEFFRTRKFKSLEEIFPINKERRLVERLFIGHGRMTCEKLVPDNELNGKFLKNKEVSKFAPKKIICAGAIFNWKNLTVHRIEYSLIGFCGKIYPVILLSLGCHKTIGDSLIAIYDKNELSKYLSKDDTYPEREFSRWLDLTSINYSSFTDYNKESFRALLSIFERIKGPIFQIKCDENFDHLDFENAPELQEVQFQKVFNPYSAYQEIRMYLGSVLTKPEKPMLTISDRDKIQQHGFDKFSFRAMKGDKKPRSKNRAKKKEE